MSPERWQQVEELFNAALEREPDARAAFLDEACAHDQSLRREVESLLKSQTQVGGFIEEAIRDAANHAAADQDSPLTQKISPYKVLRQLGRGGMGAVYLAVRDDDQFRKRVAIKLIRRGMDTEDILRRFRNERQILASLEHPNIARLFDGGTNEDGLSYFVMEYVEGKPLIDYCDTHKQTTVERLKLFRKVCSAVHYAHQNLVVHRDLKPSNIMVTPEGVPKLLDFGIAKLLNPEMSAQTISPTATAVRLMTPDYASPEQVRGDSITTASDVYSLGVLLYELLSGHRPYRVKASTPQEIVRVVCEIEPERPSTIISHTEELRGPEGELQKTLTPETVSRTREGEPEKLRRQLAGDLDNIVLMAMRKEPQRRYTSVEQFSEDLRRHLEGLPVIARKDTFAYRTEKFVKRNRVGVAVAAIIVALILGSIILTSVQSARLARERDKAARERDRAERVSAFLGDLFKVSDPSQAKGNTITAREILDKGADKITRELNDQPEVQATLMDTIGRVYYSLGLFDRAAPLLQMALERQQRILGDNHPDVLSTRAAWLASTAAIRINESNFAAAEAPAQEALDIRRKLLGNEHSDVLDSLNTLATIIYSKGDLGTAEQLFREALTLRRKLFGEDHPDIASYINNLGFLLYEKGDYQAAEPLFRDALARHRKLRGKDDPTIASSINNLALALQNQGRYDEAEPFFREALETRRKAFGEEHAGVAQSINNLAALLTDKADYAAAEPMFRRALELRRKLLPKGNSQIGVTLVGLGRLLVLRDDARAGELMLREGLEILQKSYAKDYWRVAEATSLMGESLTALKRFDEAEPLLLDGYSTFKTIRGERHRQTQQALTRLVNLYQTWGKPDKVAEYRALIPK